MTNAKSHRQHHRKTKKKMNNTILNNLTDFRFPSLHQYIPGIVNNPILSVITSNQSTNANSNLSSSAQSTIRLQQQQFQHSQHIYYYPTQDALNTAANRRNSTNNEYSHLVTVPLKKREHVLYATKPPIQFFKNVIIMFITGLIVSSFVFWVPILWLNRRLNSVSYDLGDAASNADTSGGVIYTMAVYLLAFFHLFIVVYFMFYRLLYRRLNTVYVITNKRAIIIEGTHKFEQILIYLKKKLARLHPALIYLVQSPTRSDGYSRLSMRERYETRITYLDSEQDTEDTDTEGVETPNLETSDDQIDLEFNAQATELEPVTEHSTEDEEKEEKVDMSGYVTSWKFSEMGDLFFTLYHGIGRTIDTNGGATTPDVVIGGVYFGYYIDSYILPFTTVTHAISTGFILVPDVYEVLDILIQQRIAKGAPHALPQARLIRSKKDPAIRSCVISKSYACCGLDICFCCPDDESRQTTARGGGSSIRGKITEEDFRNLTMSYSLV
jgi:hypothetical protein